MRYVAEKYRIAPVYPWKMQPQYAVLCHRDTLKWFAMLMNVEGSRLGLEPVREYDVINLRVPREEIPDLLRRKGFLPAYHMAAHEWVTILLNENVSLEEVLRMLDRSYEITKDQSKTEKQKPSEQPRKRPPGEGEVRFGRRYSDQPLSGRAWSREESLPARIREMKTLARPGKGVLEENIFYQQAMYMADYEDDFRYKGRFLRFYPTYQTMTGDQLRGYFGWRTRLRNGEAKLEQLPYVYLYLFEILCGAGVRSPEEGLEKLRETDRLFGGKDAVLQEKIRHWICDYVIYHRLDPALLPEDPEDLSAPLSVLLRFENVLRGEADPESRPADDEVFEALCRVSAYDLTASAFYKKYLEETRQAAVYTLRRLCLARKDRKMTLIKKYFGIPGRYPYQMFSGAVFYDPRKPTDTVYPVNEAVQYECSDGRWFCCSFSRTREKSRELGNLCHEIDRRLRICFGLRSVLKQRLDEKASAEQIERAVCEWYEEKKEAEKKENSPPPLEIDFSLLSKIREDADQTRDRLIVEEASEMTEELSGKEPENSLPGTTPEELVFETAETEALEEPEASLQGLSPEHTAFVRLLLEGGDWRGYVAENHLMLSLLVDEINEAFYEEFGDTVLEFDGAEPHPVEDYEEELRQYLGIG